MRTVLNIAMAPKSLCRNARDLPGRFAHKHSPAPHSQAIAREQTRLAAIETATRTRHSSGYVMFCGRVNLNMATTPTLQTMISAAAVSAAPPDARSATEPPRPLPLVSGLFAQAAGAVETSIGTRILAAPPISASSRSVSASSSPGVRSKISCRELEQHAGLRPAAARAAETGSCHLVTSAATPGWARSAPSARPSRGAARLSGEVGQVAARPMMSRCSRLAGLATSLQVVATQPNSLKSRPSGRGLLDECAAWPTVLKGDRP